jgi:hypothetical protein
MDNGHAFRKRVCREAAENVDDSDLSAWERWDEKTTGHAEQDDDSECGLL